jgi:hypothetical protein
MENIFTHPTSPWLNRGMSMKIASKLFNGKVLGREIVIGA